MINLPATRLVYRMGVDFAKPGADTTVTFAHMRLNGHVRMWDLSQPINLDVAIVRFRFDVLELEVKAAFDDLSDEVYLDIIQQFADFQVPRDVDHQLFMEQSF